MNFIDAKNNEQHRAELEAGGGHCEEVPCLHVLKKTERNWWMYESSRHRCLLRKAVA
ncbi:hypothetical protein OK016_23670 [Vibrio chagasii]|nr:hypothetical protein [Vibrio chagasii]